MRWWEDRLVSSFTNRRQNRYTGSLYFHPDDLNDTQKKLIENLSEYSYFDCQVSRGAPCFLDDGYTWPRQLVMARPAPIDNGPERVSTRRRPLAALLQKIL
mmetsp:Transcript_55930/g.121743  ORF Transcript_55930/g.121743 Transcript_55930/m.121743 type:complete len:101 (+) Transcript_55930:730-1032(+)